MDFQIIQDMYDGITTSVRTLQDMAKDYFVRMGLHQSLAMNSLFNLSLGLDVHSRDTQKIISKCILLADGILQNEGNINEDITHKIQVG